MNAGDLNLILYGALAISSWIAGLFFLRFWSQSRERLFVFFWLAFWLFGVNWISLAVVHWVPETRHQGFLVRLLGFVLIIVGVIDKNRRGRTGN